MSEFTSIKTKNYSIKYLLEWQDSHNGIKEESKSPDTEPTSFEGKLMKMLGENDATNFSKISYKNDKKKELSDIYYPLKEYVIVVPDEKIEITSFKSIAALAEYVSDLLKKRNLASEKIKNDISRYYFTSVRENGTPAGHHQYYPIMLDWFRAYRDVGNDISEYYFKFYDYDDLKKRLWSNSTASDQISALAPAVPSKPENDIFSEMIKNHKQIIFTGAPGTGKTYNVRKYVEEATGKDESRYKFVQFHSSYDYTDFVEGLRPVPDEKGGNKFVRMDGIFKAFCRTIAENNLTILIGKYDKIKDYESLYEFEKTASDDELKDMDAELDDYYFVIDEINRADLGKVFGELMFGLEESYRGIRNRFDTQYMNLDTYRMNEEGKAEKIESDCFKKGFFVPRNLHIIGTMNDIDRSVESFDFALRRRFEWVDIKANEVMADTISNMRDNAEGELSDDKLKDIIARIKKMNEAISSSVFGLTEAYHIGPAYFKALANADDDNAETVLADIFNTKIESILREYTRGRKGVNEFIGECRKVLLTPNATQKTETNNDSADTEKQD